jgi:hypothetical protein
MMRDEFMFKWSGTIMREEFMFKWSGTMMREELTLLQNDAQMMGLF